MDRLAFNAAAAINEQRLARQMITHELANVSTVGFKRSFEVAMSAIKADGSGLSTRMQPQSVSKDIIQLQPGSVITTGRNMDVSLNDESVLGVTSTNGQLAFTRRGDLQVNSAGVLEDALKHVVRSEAGGPITVPPGMTITINPDGTVYAADPAQTGAAQQTLIGRLLLRDASTTPLERRDDGLFGPIGKLGADFPNGPKLPSLTSGALEGSNVSAMLAMVKLMDQSRSFEHQVRNIKESKTADEAGAAMLKLN